MDNKLVLDGYVFADVKEYEKAKKEKEAIDYFLSNSDLNNVQLIFKLYNKLLDKGTFQTIIGYNFLKSLQERLQAGKDIPPKDIRPIYVHPRQVIKKEIKSFEADQEEKKWKATQEQHDGLKNKVVRMRIMIAFMAIIIIGMIVIAQMTPYSLFTNYEEKIVDQYQNWQVQLEQKEAELNERENALENSK